MACEEGAGFAAVEGQWLQRLGAVRNVVRQELVTRQLQEHLSPMAAQHPVWVLDVGCGQGTQAIRLARAGYHVTGLDRSDELLQQARAALASESSAVRERVRWVPADVFAFAEQQQAGWDVVCCHGVLMYLSSLSAALATLVGLTRPGGLVSVLTNQASLAMRAGMSGHWHDALASFDAAHYTNRLGLAELRADQPAAVHQALAEAGADVTAWYGIRLFTDHWPPEDIPGDDFAALLQTEAEAGRRDPYRQLAALTHTLATRHE